MYACISCVYWCIDGKMTAVGVGWIGLSPDASGWGEGGRREYMDRSTTDTTVPKDSIKVTLYATPHPYLFKAVVVNCFSFVEPCKVSIHLLIQPPARYDRYILPL